MSYKQSYEEIRKSMEGDVRYGGGASFIEMYAWRSKERAEQLLRAAKHADVVKVSIEDLELIGA